MQSRSLVYPTITADNLITVVFPRLNKNNTLDENNKQITEEYHTNNALITDVVDLTPSEWSAFTNNLLQNWEWLAEKGGNGSLISLSSEDFYKLSEEEQQKEWRKNSYSLVVQVRCEGKQDLYIDPQGYNYARYVGVLGTQESLERLHTDKENREADTRQRAKEALEARQQARADAIAKGKALFEAQKPEWAVAAILGELQQNESESQSDYFNSKTVKRIFLGWSKSTRDAFKEMRKAADSRPETAHLGIGKDIYITRVLLTNNTGGPPYYRAGECSRWHSKEEGHGEKFSTKAEAEAFLAQQQPLRDLGTEHGPISFAWQIEHESVENREKYSMGHGYYLGTDRYSGWHVRKQSLSYSCEDVYLALAEQSEPQKPTAKVITLPTKKKAEPELTTIEDCFVAIALGA